MQRNARVQFQFPPEDGSVEVVCVSAVDGVQVAGGGELGCELAPGHLQDLVGDVSLDHLDKVLHLMPVKLQLPKLHRASGAFNQRWGGNRCDWSAFQQKLRIHFLSQVKLLIMVALKHSGLLLFVSLCDTNLTFIFFLLSISEV